MTVECARGGANNEDDGMKQNDIIGRFELLE
jgi:hypothetical protein